MEMDCWSGSLGKSQDKQGRSELEAACFTKDITVFSGESMILGTVKICHQSTHLDCDYDKESAASGARTQRQCQWLLAASCFLVVVDLAFRR